MNRLTARGIALDASAHSKTVLVVMREVDVRDAILWMTSGGFEHECTRISRAAGAGSIRYRSGGSVDFRDPARHGTTRGVSAHLVYVDDWPRTRRLEQELEPVTAEHGGEVVWA